MADEDYGDDDAFYFDDDDYLYVEDDYAIADELAETQVPSPGYAGVNDEIANESFEYDVYEYFGELEYGSDSYWDARIKHLASAKAGEKRKSGVGEDEAAVIKKRRKDDGLEARDNVVFIPFEERLAPLPPKVCEEGGFALLPDWKERFPEGIDDGEPTRKRMPADMRRAAEAEDEADEEEEGRGREEADTYENEMDFNSDEYEDEDEDDGAAGVDQDVIMQVLRQKLADSGLGDVDESVFKDAIAKLLSGEGDSEDALGGLTSLLLGQKDGGGKAFEGFLAGQGVDVNRAEDAEEEGVDTEDEDEQEEVESHSTAQTTGPTPTPTPKNKARSKTTSASTATPNRKTPTTRGKSKATSSTTTATTATTNTNTNSKSKPASPIVVPSPPPLSFKTSRKRRAPSLDEPAVPQPEAPSNSAKPAAKRRRAPRAEPPTTEPETAPSVAPATGRRTTRSAAADGKDGR
ncbi:hypothetical protein Q7P35_007368 [Cladosporium inversicolor]